MLRPFSSLMMIPTLAMLLAGCPAKPATEEKTESGSVSMSEPPPPTVDGHSHPSEGPHHGDLIELGAEEYHAELVHTDKSVTIYILDGSAKTAVPIEAADVMINLVHDGKPEQFKLPAFPDESDPVGKSSRFQLDDADLAHDLDHGDANAKLNLMINGKAYRGDLKHDHDHDHDHGHAH